MFWIVLGQKYSVFTRLNGIKSYRLNFRDTRETSGVVVVVFKTTVYRRSGVAGRVGRRMQPPKHTAFALCRLRARNTFSLRAPPQLFRATLSRTIRADDAVSLFYVRFMQRVVGIKNAFFFFLLKTHKRKKEKKSFASPSGYVRTSSDFRRRRGGEAVTKACAEASRTVDES